MVFAEVTPLDPEPLDPHQDTIDYMRLYPREEEEEGSHSFHPYGDRYYLDDCCTLL